MKRICAAMAILAVMLCTATPSRAEITLGEQLAALRAEIETIMARLEALQASIDTIMPTILTPAAGLSRSAADPVHAMDASDTLATLLPVADNLFGPVSSTIKLSFGSSSLVGEFRVEPRVEFRVESISSDGADGVHVTYVVDDGEPVTLHLQEDDFNAPNYYKEIDDGRFWFWSETGSFYGPEKNRGSAQFKYFDAYGVNKYRSEDRLVYRSYMTAGARTEAANMPVGTASYFGRMAAQTHLKNNPATSQRGYMRGRMSMTADFDASTLEGRISGIQRNPSGPDGYSLLPDTTYFEIENGKIVDGQFTADLTGRDTNAVASISDTVRGYEGDILGEFYGPAAEEVGGVLNASSSAHHRVLSGWFGGKQPDVPEVDQPVLSNAAKVDLPGSTSELTDAAEVTSIKDDGAGGFRVTYVVDGEEETVHLDASSYGNVDGQIYYYQKRDGDRSHWLRDPGGYSGVSGFSYFDVKWWSVTDWADEGYDFQSYAGSRGFAVYGTPTETDDLPAATATYAGSAHAVIHSTTDPNLSARRYARGSLTLNADFGASTISGMIDEIAATTAGGSNVSYHADTNGHITIENGAISNSGFTADLTGTQDFASFEGDMEGRFYGPAAAEAGGTFTGTDSTQNTVMLGYFGGRKQ